jgi:hypothetical protein
LAEMWERMMVVTLVVQMVEKKDDVLVELTVE